MIDVDQVDNLIKFCPTKEEAELLKVFLFLVLIQKVSAPVSRKFRSYYHPAIASFVSKLMLHLLSWFSCFP